MGSQLAEGPIATAVGEIDAPRYGKDEGFHQALRVRVRELLESSGLPARGLPAMYVKTAVLFLWLVASYLLLVFAAETAWQAVPLAVSLGLAIAGIGFNVQHDGSLGSYSTRPGVNRLMARTLDLRGGSSFVWQRKHNVLHQDQPGFDQTSASSAPLTSAPPERMD